MTRLDTLYAIVDVDLCQRANLRPLDLARAYLAGGARLLQLRAKNLTSGAFLDLAVALVDEAKAADARVIVNDRADLAVLAAASGVHVGQDDLAPQDVRRVLGSERLLGLSTHTPEQVQAALAEPISYLAIGPVFSTSTKATGYDSIGLDAVRDAARQASTISLPLVAIGGITLSTAPRVIEAGAAAVAVISDLMTADPEARVRQFVQALQ